MLKLDGVREEKFREAYENAKGPRFDSRKTIQALRNAEPYDLSLITETPFGFFMTENDTMCTDRWA